MYKCVLFFFTLSKIILWMKSRVGREAGVRVEVGVAKDPHNFVGILPRES